MKSTIKIIIFLFVLPLFSQKRQSFIGYGKNPTKGHKKYIENINRSRSFGEKYIATTKLLEFHNQRGNLDSVIVYGKNLFNEIKRYPNAKHSAKIATTIAKAKMSKGLYDDGLKWYLQGIAFANKQEDKNLYYENRVGIALSKYTKGENVESQAILQECIDNLTDETIKSDTYFYYGEILFDQGKNQEAKIYFEKALAINQRKKNLKKTQKIQLNLTRILDRNNKNTEALKGYFEIYNLALKNNFYDLYINSANNIGRLYTKLENYNFASKILHSAYINSVEWNNLDAQRKIISSLITVSVKSKNYKNAYGLYAKRLRLEQEISDYQNKKQVNELEIKYETFEKEQELKSQRLQKKYILGGFIILLIPLLTLFYVYYQKLQTQSKLNEILKKVNDEKIATLLKTQELELIKASIEGEEKERNRIAKELHDTVGGNLASIKLQLSSENQKHIMNQIDETYHQVRDLSHNLSSEKFNKNSFSKLLTTYIQNIKKGSKQEINLQLFPELKINTLTNTIKTELFKIIQELITNTLKHANSKEITIQITQTETEVKLLFEDDGIGFNPNKIQDGIGFKNIKERLVQINGTLHIDSHKNRGTIIDIDVVL